MIYFSVIYPPQIKDLPPTPGTYSSNARGSDACRVATDSGPEHYTDTHKGGGSLNVWSAQCQDDPQETTQHIIQTKDTHTPSIRREIKIYDPAGNRTRVAWLEVRDPTGNATATENC